MLFLQKNMSFDTGFLRFFVRFLDGFLVLLMLFLFSFFEGFSHHFLRMLFKKACFSKKHAFQKSVLFKSAFQKSVLFKKACFSKKRAFQKSVLFKKACFSKKHLLFCTKNELRGLQNLFTRSPRVN